MCEAFGAFVVVWGLVGIACFIASSWLFWLANTVNKKSEENIRRVNDILGRIGVDQSVGPA